MRERSNAGGQTPNRPGFTLIEVLVVVAIVAMLTAILLPSLAKARENARLVTCRANLHDFGLALQQYADASRGYFPLPCYVGTTIYENSPDADDNLITLWIGRYTRDVGIYACPATPHKVRTPERIEKTPLPGKGIRYDVYTAGELRNDFECHGQVIQETKSSGGVIDVHLNGTSYEYDGGWYVPSARFAVDPGNPTKTSQLAIETVPSWYPFNAKNTNPKTGAPRRLGTIKDPAKESAMRDADEGESNGGDVVGAIPGRATNNLPEPWDNHGKKISNMLHFDGHVVSYPAAYWEAAASRKGGIYIGY